MAKVKLTVKMPSDAELDRLFATAPVLERYKVQDKAVRAAAKPVVNRAKQLAPRSSVTGTAKKRSKKQSGQADWSIVLATTIKAVVRKFSTGAYAKVGPDFPKGAKVHFNSAHVKGFRRAVLWGKATMVKPYRQDDWLKRAGDETVAMQREAMKASIKKSLDEMMPRG